MSSRRQALRPIKDYSNLQKKTTCFSPSPIKRYNTSQSKSFIVQNDNKINSQSICSAANNQNNQNNKENFIPKNNITHQLSSLQGKRARKPLQELFRQPISDKLLTQTNKISTKQVDEIKKPSSNFQNTNISHFDIQFYTQAAIDDIPLKESAKKRENKNHQKNIEKEKIVNLKTEIQYTAILQQQILNSSHKSFIDQSQIINNQFEQESDLLMEGTFQSQTSLPNSLQYQGRWTHEEHNKFLEGLKMFGKDWRQIEDYIGSRTCAQIRSHAQKYFNRLNREQVKTLKQDSQLIPKKRKRHTDEYSESKIQESDQQTQQEQQPFKEEQPIVKQIPPLQLQTNQQIQQIHDTFQKISNDDSIIQTKALIDQREDIALGIMLKRVDPENACEQLIEITNSFHELALKALQNSKFELCNRLIEERNLTQFVCILISSQITVVSTQQDVEIIQHIHQSPLGDICQHVDNQCLAQESHDRETARSSPKDRTSDRSPLIISKYQSTKNQPLI